jgi:hypothetical protein
MLIFIKKKIYYTLYDALKIYEKEEKTKDVINYNLLMKTRVVNKRTNLGNMYLENTNINSAIIANANVT